jgi:hypothetical protein
MTDAETISATLIPKPLDVLHLLSPGACRRGFFSCAGPLLVRGAALAPRTWLVAGLTRCGPFRFHRGPFNLSGPALHHTRAGLFLRRRIVASGGKVLVESSCAPFLDGPCWRADARLAADALRSTVGTAARLGCTRPTAGLPRSVKWTPPWPVLLRCADRQLWLSCPLRSAHSACSLPCLLGLYRALRVVMVIFGHHQSRCRAISQPDVEQSTRNMRQPRRGKPIRPPSRAESALAVGPAEANRMAIGYWPPLLWR